jgi:lysophospholipid hydrolase
MVLGMGDDPNLGEYERLLLSMKTTARKELVLLHPDRSVAPGSTREWLKVPYRNPLPAGVGAEDHF